jgi:hypothetical protein
MVEYGNGVSQATGATGGGGGGGSTDLVGSAVHFVSDAVDRVAALPPEVLIGAAVILLVGFLVLRRAF